MFRRSLNILLILALTLGLFSTAFAQDGVDPNIPIVDVSSLALPDGSEVTGIAPELLEATGEIQVVVRLVDPPLASVVGTNAKQKGSSLKPNQQKGYLRMLDQKQQTLIDQIGSMNGKELSRVSKALNAVIVSVDASRLAEIAGLPNVASIRPVINYEVDLSETVPYIGAAAVQAAGVDVLLDDRGERPGVMFADLELVGIPHRITIGERGLKEGLVEYQARTDKESRNIPLNEIENFVKSALCTA